MNRYEILILTVPTLTQDEMKRLQDDVEKVIQKGGEVISFEKWGKYKLAYPVKKNEYGIYLLVRFGLKADKTKETLDQLNTFLSVKLTDLVMRHVVTLLDAKKSLEYQRPQSLEEIPVQESEDELSKSKIEKILSKTESKRSYPKKKPDAQEEVVKGS